MSDQPPQRGLLSAYATVSWTFSDVQTLAPRLTDEEARAWLQANERHIASRLVEMGWDVIADLLRFDQIDTSSL